VRFAEQLEELAFAARELIAGRDARTLAEDLFPMTQAEISAAFRKSAMNRHDPPLPDISRLSRTWAAHAKEHASARRDPSRAAGVESCGSTTSCYRTVLPRGTTARGGE
jgi:hypothetical protein